MAEGEQFGRYQLIRLVGSGGMAEVHLARQVGPQGFVKPCVLKRISPELASDPRTRKMFLDEARLSALLNHPHIVQTFDFGEVDGTPFMALELVDGVNLAQLCRMLADKERWMPVRPALEIGIDVAEALEYAHTLKNLGGAKDLKLVHRDVSPQNILLSRQGGVKLADFGIALHDDREERTVGTSAKGKPGYIAPEQALSTEVDGRADLFSLGVVLVELLSGRRVMRSVTDLLTIPRRVAELLALRPEAPPGLVALLLSLTSLEPKSRPRSARDVASSLRAAVSEIPERESLSDFLHGVFTQFFPPDAAHGSIIALAGGTDGAVHTDVPAAPASPISLPVPPEGDGEALGFERKEWAQKEKEPTSTAVVYGGWPKEYLDKGGAPEIQLVSRSSSVDAMKFFGAKGSSTPKEEPEAPAEGAPQSAANKTAPHRTPSAAGGMLGGTAEEDEDLAPRELPKVLQNLVDPDEKRDAEEKRKRLHHYAMLAAVGLLIGGLGLGVLSLLTDTQSRQAGPVAAKTGTLSVVTNVSGARVLIDGLERAASTPAEIDGLPVNHPLRVQVQRPGYMSVPTEVSVKIPESTRRTGVSFTLRKGRIFQIETTPEGATVSFNGRQLSEVTPLALPSVVLGSTATLAISLPDHIPVKLLLPATAQTATIAAIKLELGKEIDVVSEPAGAKVMVDGQERGVTPVYDLLVPVGRKFRMKATRRGFKPWTKTLSGKSLSERTVEVELQPVPLLAMPMSKEERAEARDWDRRLTRLASDLRRAKVRLATAEKQLQQAESSPNFFVEKLSSAQREATQARTRFDDLENELGEVESQVDSFRQKVMNRLEGINEEN